MFLLRKNGIVLIVLWRVFLSFLKIHILWTSGRAFHIHIPIVCMFSNNFCDYMSIYVVYDTYSNYSHILSWFCYRILVSYILSIVFNFKWWFANMDMTCVFQMNHEVQNYGKWWDNKHFWLVFLAKFPI